MLASTALGKNLTGPHITENVKLRLIYDTYLNFEII